MTTSSDSSNDDDDKEEGTIGQSVLNLYDNGDTVNTAETTIKDGNPLENLLKFNYLSTDDMIKNIGKRHYNFPVVNLNFNENEKAVSEDNKASPTDISSIIYTTDNKNNEDDDDEDDEDDKDTDDDNNTTSVRRRRTAIVSQQSTERDGLSAFINNFFSSVQSIFE